MRWPRLLCVSELATTPGRYEVSTASWPVARATSLRLTRVG